MAERRGLEAHGGAEGAGDANRLCLGNTGRGAHRDLERALTLQWLIRVPEICDLDVCRDVSAAEGAEGSDSDAIWAAGGCGRSGEPEPKEGKGGAHA